MQIIITLASPNKYPLIQLDSYVAAYYNKIQLAWRNNSNLSHISFASIGGGIRDLIVRSDSIYDPLSHVNVLVSHSFIYFNDPAVYKCLFHNFRVLQYLECGVQMIIRALCGASNWFLRSFEHCSTVLTSIRKKFQLI